MAIFSAAPHTARERARSLHNGQLIGQNGSEITRCHASAAEKLVRQVQSESFPLCDTKTILIVTSNFDGGPDLRKGLWGAGYTVEMASPAGARCHASLAGVESAILIVSGEYRRMGDTWFAIERNISTLPVIVLGPDVVPFKLQFFDYGTDDYLVELFDQQEVLARIRSLIRRRKLFSLL
jgi:PleD family two-component response regulator